MNCLIKIGVENEEPQWCKDFLPDTRINTINDYCVLYKEYDQRLHLFGVLFFRGTNRCLALPVDENDAENYWNIYQFNKLQIFGQEM